MNSLTVLIAILQVNIAIGILYIRFRPEFVKSVTAFLYRGRLFQKIVNKFNSSPYAANIDSLFIEFRTDHNLYRQHSSILEWIQELPPEGLSQLNGADHLKIQQPDSDSRSKQPFILVKFHQFLKSHIHYVWALTIIPAIISLWLLLFFASRPDVFPFFYLVAFLGQCVPLWNLARGYYTLWRVQRVLSKAIDYVMDLLQESAQEQLRNFRSSQSSSEV